MNFSPLVLVVAAASAGLAAKPASAHDLSSFTQDGGNYPATREAPGGLRLDTWSRGGMPSTYEHGFAAIANENGVNAGHLTPAVSDIGAKPEQADSAGATVGANKPSAKKPTPYTFKYERQHKTYAKTTIEVIELARSIGHGVSVGVAQEWLPKPKADKSAGDAFHSLEPYKTKLDVNYSLKLGQNMTLKHRLRNEFRKSKRETKARFQLQVKLLDDFSVTPGYERENVYSREGKPNLYINILSVELEYKRDKFKYKYTREYFHSTNGVIYNNSRHNYKNKYVIAYAGDRFEPYLEVRNSSRSSTRPGREDDIRLGIKYRF
ncbi:MAG TPA: oligogalacturonate-specific porin KdgM family protein [Rhodanobacter sp.]